MLAYAIYTAQFGLIGGHTAGQNYSFDFETSDIRTPSGDVLKTTQESISGVVETNYYGERLIWTVVTIPLSRSSSEALLMREFLRSTSDGQEFALDPYGIEADPVAAMTVIREDSGFTEEKFIETDGPADYVLYTFSVREV